MRKVDLPEDSNTRKGGGKSGICNPDRPLQRFQRRRKKNFRGSGKNAGNRHRGKPLMAMSVLDEWVIKPMTGTATINRNAFHPVSNDSDEMWDTHGFIQEWYNPMTQEKLDAGDPRIPPIIDECQSTYVDFGQQGISIRDSIRTTLPFLNTDQLDELKLRSEEKLSQVVNSETSLFNFLIELATACTGNIRGIRRFSEIYSRCVEAYRRYYAKLIREGHKASAAHWLAWNFAIKPAISDLRAILCSLTAANKKLKWLQANNRKIIYLDYHRKDLADLVEIPAGFTRAQWIASVIDANILDCNQFDMTGLDRYPNGSFDVAVRYSEVTIEYHARSKIYLDIPDEYLKGMKGLGVLWEAMMGLHNPVGIIWEAIPFSWLIDYFLSYRARLWQSAYDYNPYNAGVEVLGYGHSFTIHAKGDAVLNCYLPHEEDGHLQHNNYGGFEYFLKWRKKGLPVVETGTLFRVPGDWYKFSIIGAIGIGIIPGRRR